MPTPMASTGGAEAPESGDRIARLGETRVTFGTDELGEFFARFEPLDLSALLDDDG